MAVLSDDAIDLILESVSFCPVSSLAEANAAFSFNLAASEVNIDFIESLALLARSDIDFIPSDAVDINDSVTDEIILDAPDVISESIE